MDEPKSQEETTDAVSGASVAEKVEEPDNALIVERPYSMVDDSEICNFVREKLNSLPILALSELTKARQVILLKNEYVCASLGEIPELMFFSS